MINAEIKTALPSTAIIRDARLIKKQEQINTCLAALADIVTKLISKKQDADIPTISTIKDVLQILADFHREETVLRLNLIIGQLNPSLKEALLETKAEKSLFGNNLEELIKARKKIENSLRVFTSSSKNNNKAPKNGKYPPRPRTREHRPLGGYRSQSSKKPYSRSSRAPKKGQNHQRGPSKQQ
ncbi:hypothetical protein TKK_0010264 [Trichogramma kaykai]